MNKVLPFIFIVLLSAYKVSIQHCPFDGSSIVIIKLVDKKGKVISSLKDSVILAERDNPKADSCSYANGLLSIPFEDLNKALIMKYENGWISWAKKYSVNCSFMKPGHFAVVLGQAQEICMIDNGSGYRYQKRIFEIWVKNGDKTTTVNLPEEKIYQLCTNFGPWTRIQPIEIVIDK
jgi:hypothetical protein